MNFQTHLSQLDRTLKTRPAEALALAEALEDEILGAGIPDRAQLGKAREYRVRCLYKLGRFTEGLALGEAVVSLDQRTRRYGR